MSPAAAALSMGVRGPSRRSLSQRERGAAMTSERSQFARALRKQRTRAEEVLWAELRGSRFHGAKFRRQVPLDRYVVDFFFATRRSWSSNWTAGNMNGSRSTT